MIKSGRSSADSLNAHDVFWYIVLRWKTLLLIMVISAVLLAVTEGLYLNKLRKEQQADEQTPQTVQTENIPEGKAAILEQTLFVTVQAGKDAVFSVRTSGKVQSYRWQFSKDGINWSNLSLNTYPSAGTDTLMLTVTPTHNHYEFRCRVTFEDDTVLTSREAILTVTTDAVPLTKISGSDVIKRTVKYAVAGCLLGALGGALALAGYFALQGYPVNGLIIQKRYHMNCFGVLRQKSQNKVSERILNRLTYEQWKDDLAALIAARLEPNCQSDQPILLIGNVSSQTLNRVASLIQPYLSCQVVPAGDLHVQAEAVIAAAKYRQVVCVEDILKSKRIRIDSELDILKRAGAECIGFILTE